MDYSPPGSSVHVILQVRILEWVVIPFSRWSSWPRDWTWVSCIAGKATREANFYCCICKFIFSVVLGLLMIPLKEFSMSVIVYFIFSILIWLNTLFQPAESFICLYIINIFCKILINYHYFKLALIISKSLPYLCLVLMLGLILQTVFFICFAF